MKLNLATAQLCHTRCNGFFSAADQVFNDIELVLNELTHNSLAPFASKPEVKTTQNPVDFDEPCRIWFQR